MPAKDRDERNRTWKAWYQKNRQRLAAKKDELRRRNPERYKEYQERAKKSRRQALAEYKLERGCAICGYRGHPEALEFDHLPGSNKKERLSVMYRAKWSEVVKEIAKCQVLCANCHAIETAARRRATREVQKREKTEQQLRLHLA